ncbi:kinetochore protein Spc25-like [Stomoxys calcitrans]|uniref:Uncharacterized protein n=1 Tax=Stomoxys calcitrans TaxID=35570 RepID=A0A1I8NRL1_STOCA|nr:kinetochore protein Spc25-like [Stomoxys calcitrans]
MDKRSYVKRLNRLISKECEITEMETKIARKSAKYWEKITNLKTIMAKQENELRYYRRQVDKIKMQNEKLEAYIHSEEQRLNGIMETVERLREEHEKVKDKQIMKRKLEMDRKEFIRNIKETTQTYFNMDALPQRFEGVRVCETETSSMWIPFSVDAKEWMQYLEEQWSLWQQNHHQEQMELDSAGTKGYQYSEQIS